MKHEQKTQEYTCYAEHCNGQSASHSCAGGAFFDPTDMWEITVQAIDEDHARDLAKLALKQEVVDFEPCTCQKKSYTSESVGSPAWWDSVAIVVEVTDSE